MEGLERVEYSITDQCNLNCAYCCHYASIANKYYVTKEQFEHDVMRLSSLTYNGKYLDTLGILGGEPLLHKDFIDLCIIARKYLPYSRVRVTTNGLLLNKLSKKDLCLLRRFDIEILISKYREIDDFEAIDKLLTEYNIIHKFCSNNELVTFYKYSLDENGNQDAIIAHDNCDLWKSYYTCHELRDGYLYPCSQITRVATLNEKFGLNLPNKELSGIDIHTNTLDSIVKWVNNPVEHCKYCKTLDWKVNKIGKWQPSTKEKEEFV